MPHYMVVSPEMHKVIPILDDGAGPMEYFCCVCFVDAPNRKTALQLAIKDPLMKDWVDDQRSDGKNPFVGLKATHSQCKHGRCFCDDCIREFGECEECLDEAEKEINE